MPSILPVCIIGADAAIPLTLDDWIMSAPGVIGRPFAVVKVPDAPPVRGVFFASLTDDNFRRVLLLEDDSPRFVPSQLIETFLMPVVLAAVIEEMSRSSSNSSSVVRSAF